MPNEDNPEMMMLGEATRKNISERPMESDRIRSGPISDENLENIEMYKLQGQHGSIILTTYH